MVFCLRSYVRLCIRRSWIFEDSLVLAAWVQILSNLEGRLEWTNVTSIVYGLVMLIVKTAILLFYRRIFLTQKGELFDWVLRVFMAIIIIFYGTTTLIKIWLCAPREKIWDHSVPGHCLSISSLFNASGLFNWLTDILILLIPVKTLWRLQMSARKKAGIAAVFTLGFGYGERALELNENS
ncbi:MAG: hypothetical protein L6R42_005165 [Xanthoria sp. 1 TBL-2021]|nr:MAG: hypothetical protein L6R42_005165 [Xanthoria sp. 1 TBL-2021]